jgi:NAD(P)-dependent dehydrogenase (short-subunit alcohol dehydrogenase family)
MKSIFITGASAGIGKATATLFARKGWFVGITDVNEAGLRELKSVLGDSAGFVAPLDVTDGDRAAAVLHDFNQAAGGRIDVLFNNAGILRVNPFENVPLADYHAMLDINNKGILNCTYHAFPYLRNTGGSRVVNMASVSSIVATPAQVGYSASKFWVRGFTETLNIEWKRHGIHVCDVMPNYVRTTMVEQNPGKLADRMGVHLTAEAVADTVWQAAHGKRLHWIVDRPHNKLYYRFRGLFFSSLERFVLGKMAGF